MDNKKFDSRKMHARLGIKSTYESWVSQDFPFDLKEGEDFFYENGTLFVSQNAALLLCASAKKSKQVFAIGHILGLEKGQTSIYTSTLDPNVIDFFDSLPRNTRISTTTAYDEFIENNPGYVSLDRRSFGNYLVKYCQNEDVSLFRGASSKMGGRYFMFNDSTY